MVMIVFTALALSADSLAAGLALGLRRVRIGPSAQWAVGLLSAGLAALSILLGNSVGEFLPSWLSGSLGAAALVGIGALGIWNSLKPPLYPSSQETLRIYRDPGQGDLDGSGTIDPKEALLLAFSLSVDMLGAGIGLGLGGMASLWLLPPCVGTAQAFLLWVGAKLGGRLSHLPFERQSLGVLSGLLLIGLGGARLLF